jgi:hypothetical protein
MLLPRQLGVETNAVFEQFPGSDRRRFNCKLPDSIEERSRESSDAQADSARYREDNREKPQ